MRRRRSLFLLGRVHLEGAAPQVRAEWVSTLISGLWQTQCNARSFRPSADETTPVSASVPATTFAPPNVTSTALTNTFALTSARSGTRDPTAGPAPVTAAPRQSWPVRSPCPMPEPTASEFARASRTSPDGVEQQRAAERPEQAYRRGRDRQRGGEIHEATRLHAGSGSRRRPVERLRDVPVPIAIP